MDKTNEKNLKAVFLIHGEEEKQKIFKQKIIEKFDLKTHIVEPQEIIGL